MRTWVAEVKPSIADVDGTAWDALGGSCYSRTGWLQMLGDRLASTALYLTVRPWDGDHAQAAAVCYVFTEGQEPPQHDIARLLSALADRPDPRIADLRPALTVSVPGVASPLRWDRGLPLDEQRAALEALLDAILAEAHQRDVRSTAVLYVEHDEVLDAVLTEAGFLSAELEPNCVLPIEWDSFGAYLAALPRGHRKAVLRDFRRFADSGLDVDIRSAAEYGPELVMLAMQTRARYGSSTDPEPFLESARYMRENLADDFVVFCALRDGAVVGFSLFQKYQGVLSGVRVGFDYLATTGTHAYFQLNYACPIRWAIENGYQLIDYGTEAYEAKLRRGGQLRRTMAYLAPRPCLRDQAGRLAAEQTARMALLRRSILGKDQ